MRGRDILLRGAARPSLTAQVQALFAGGKVGGMWDMGDTSTLFQNTAGTTPVTAVTQPIGIVLDKSQGLVRGVELISNGSFDTDTIWSKGTGWSITGGAATSVGANQFQALTQTAATISGKTYEVSFVVSRTSGSLLFRLGSGANKADISASGSYRYVVQADGGSIAFLSNATGFEFVGTIDNVSVKELPGNHATQPTAGSRPLFSARNNLLTKSEQFNDGVWVNALIAVNTDNATAPDGTVTAEKLCPTAVSGVHVLEQNSLSIGTGIAVLSVYAKAAEYTRIALRESTTTGAWSVFDVSGGTVLGSGGGASSTAITSVGNGWYRCTMTVSAASAGLATHVVSPSWVSGSPNGQAYTGNGTDGIYVWGAQLEQVALSRYQRVNTASDYDTVGFPAFAQFDGINDLLQVSGINLSTTNKVLIGLAFKPNTTALTVAMEYSTTAVSNVGAFYVSLNESGTGKHNMLANNGGGGLDVVTLSSAVALAPTVLIDYIDLAQLVAIAKHSVRVNGASAGITSVIDGPDVAGNFGNYDLFLGARSGGSFPSNMNIHRAFIRAGDATAGEQLILENWLRESCGV